MTVLMVQRSASIAASGQATPISGEAPEIPPFNAFVEVGINGSAAGLVASVWIGGQSAGDNVQINALNRFPVLPDDLLVINGICPAGQRNRVLITNPTAGALTHFTFMKASAFPRGR